MALNRIIPVGKLIEQTQNIKIMFINCTYRLLTIRYGNRYSKNQWYA
jgi:hypothetical protein